MAAKRRAETMEENRAKLITAARKSFAERGFAAVSMDELTASVGLTRGALYHNFGDKKGLLAAVVAQVDGEMAQRAKAAAANAGDDWERLLAEGIAYIKMALDTEVRRIVFCLMVRLSLGIRHNGPARIVASNPPARLS